MTAARTRRPPRRPPAKPIIYGPTWEKSRGQFVMPAHSLGLAAIEWAEANLQQPDGPDAGDPWRFTYEQARFLMHFYEVTRAGSFRYRRAVLRRIKGWGKDPLGAVLCAIEFLGPCRFAGWKGREALAQDNPSAWVQCIGVAQEQTKNTMVLFPQLFTRACIEEHAIDIGQTRIYAYGGARRIEAITSSPDTAEGNRPTFCLPNETQHWTQATGGHDMLRAINRNLAKARDGSARSCAITNAHTPGEDSVAERDYVAHLNVLAGRARPSGVLYDSLEAPDETDLDDPVSLRAGILAAAGDSSWVNPDRLMEEIYDPQTSVADARRFYLNKVHAADTAWLAPHEWGRQARPGHEIPDGALVTLGLSGRRKTDSTALMACEVETGFIKTLGVWEPPKGGEVERLEVDLAVISARTSYDVVGFYARLDPFQAWVEDWEKDWSEVDDDRKLLARITPAHPIAVDERARHAWRTKAAEAFHAAVLEGILTHDGDPSSSPHFINARRVLRSGGGVDIDKETAESTNLIDAARAAILARQAREDYLALPPEKQRQTSEVRLFFA